MWTLCFYSTESKVSMTLIFRYSSTGCGARNIGIFLVQGSVSARPIGLTFEPKNWNGSLSARCSTPTDSLINWSYLHSSISGYHIPPGGLRKFESILNVPIIQVFGTVHTIITYIVFPHPRSGIACKGCREAFVASVRLIFGRSSIYLCR